MWVDKPEDEESTEQQTDSLNSPSVGAGAGSEGGLQPQSSTTAAVGTPSSMSPTPVAPGQKFGSIQDYFKGSKTQGEQLGEQFTSKLDATKQQQQGFIDEAATGAQGQIAANTVGLDQNLLSKAVADPTKIAGDEAEYDKFMQQWNAAYKGPESLEGSSEYEKAAKATQTAKDRATQTESTGGRQQLIQDEFGVYGAGNKGLDEALLQQSSYFPKVGEKAQELNSLQDYLKSKSGEVAGKAQEAKATTEQTKQTTQDALLGETGAVQKFKTDIDTRTSQEQAKAAQDIQALQTAVEAKADLSDAQLKMLGTTRQEYKDLIQKPGAIVNPVSLKEYLTSQNPAAKISRETVAGTQDVAKDQALAKLTGRSNLLGAQQTQGKLVDFDKDQALQDYLNSINADQEQRDAARREREEQQRLDEEERVAKETAERKGVQNTIAGNIATGGIDLMLPGAGNLVGGKLDEVISKDKLLGEAKKDIGQESQKVIDAVRAPIKSISKSISKAFCFDGDTMIDLADGKKASIRSINLGDHIKGGRVLSVRQSITDDNTRYSYSGIIVTGSHAVKERRWMRVKDSLHAIPIVDGGVVYSLVTTSHRIYVNGIMFADEHETDMYETLTMDQSLAELNRVPLKVC